MASSCSCGGSTVTIGVLEMLMQDQRHSRHGGAEVLVEVELGANPHVCEIGVASRRGEEFDVLEIVVADQVVRDATVVDADGLLDQSVALEVV